ncbi:MAG TPA: hypothetical protein VKC54_02400 [Patescibacteria group bacterium]|nr:hypothetical protein [Patescibacteria group bacterium]
MKNEREVQILRKRAKMPKNVFDQIKDFPGEAESKMICLALEARIRNVFEAEGEEILSLTWRIKSDESIKEKIKRKNSKGPIRDKFGLMIQANLMDRIHMAQRIQADFPLTPKFFANGFPSIREYADPKVRRFVQQNFNPNISDLYGAMHVNVAFLTGNSAKLKIAEIQIMTPEEFKIYWATRGTYENTKK